MAHYIDKDALVAEIENRRAEISDACQGYIADKKMAAEYILLNELLDFINTLEVKEINSIVNPYDVCIQYTDKESAIKAHAEDYSWNIESELFQQLTPEQQKLWRKEIEQAVISGGYSGLNLAKDPRYKENLEVKEVELSWEDISAIICIDKQVCGKMGIRDYVYNHQKAMEEVLKRFKAQKGEEV